MEKTNRLSLAFYCCFLGMTIAPFSFQNWLKVMIK